MYYPDRPGNMATFERVCLEASQVDYPMLLADGNLLEFGLLSDGRHYTVWQDPILKPSYLLYCVVGQLVEIIQDYVVTTKENKGHTGTKIKPTRSVTP
jgi:aminopeptidase N